MESPTSGSQFSSRNSKKRGFQGGSSSSGLKEVEISQTAASGKRIATSSKREEAAGFLDIIDVDIEDCNDTSKVDVKGKGKAAADFPDIMDVDIEEDCNYNSKADLKGKGKVIPSDISADFSNFSNNGSASDSNISKKRIELDDPKSNLFSGEDDGIDTYYDDDHSDSVLQSQFDDIYLPTGVVVPLPWMQSFPQNSAIGASDGSSSSNLKEGRVGKSVPGKKKTKAFWSHFLYATLDLLVYGRAYRPGPNDFAGDQNVETSAAAHMDLDEIKRNFETFKKFDMVEDCSDHNFVKVISSNEVTPPKNWAKKIQDEWKILEKDLPDTIFVRVYESRMDLLRAAIVGAEGTPYHDGLFFFDVFFPDNYPNSPPKVHYRSGGLQLNPNLYNFGKVCLSLLNTWNGSKEEMWQPGVSTMLQVLVSIQGLILNAKPYYNDPGYASLIGTEAGEERALKYNEMAFIFSLRTMVYTMNRPPKHFEALVAGHFVNRAWDILVSCRAYLGGARVGCLVRGNKSCSQSFKNHLADFITTLVNALTKTGAQDCHEFLALAEVRAGRVRPSQLPGP